MRHSFAEPRQGSDYGNYAFRIYNAEHSWANRDDNIFWEREDCVDSRDLSVDDYATCKDEIIDLFNEHIEIFEGATYCIKDTDSDEVIVGGVFDRQDIDLINKYFAQCD